MVDGFVVASFSIVMMVVVVVAVGKCIRLYYGEAIVQDGLIKGTG